MLAACVEVGPAGVADQQRVTGHHEPGLVAARVIGHQVGVMGERVTRCGDRLDVDVAEPDDLAVAQRVMGELDARALGQISHSTSPGDQLGHARDVVGLHVRLEDGNHRRALGARKLDVSVDEIDVGVDDRELAAGLAPEQVGGAGGLVVQQLAEEHVGLRKFDSITLDKLASDLLNNNGWDRERRRTHCSRRSR